ncbi:MAG: hypothetical protein AAB906_02150 [Patescibacteria group bacterium]
MNRNIWVLLLLGLIIIVIEALSVGVDFSLTSILDVALIVVGIVTLHFGKIIGGTFGAKFKMVFFGFVLLVFGHALETILFSLRLINQDTGEALHRILVLTGFICITIGFYQIKKSTQESIG